jgi:alkyl hydroperoxide reductase subunit AhpC
VGRRGGVQVPLLSDFWPHGEVARRYGVFLPGPGFATRGSFLVDSAGVLRWSTVQGPGTPRDPQAYRDALAALTGSGGRDAADGYPAPGGL